MVRLFCIEGNIAAGKSTVLQHLQQLDGDLVVIPERVESWCGRETGLNFLQQFYNDPASNAFPFQLMVLHTRVHDIMKAMREQPQNAVVVVERSLESDRIFAEQNKKMGRISKLEWAVYEFMYEENKRLIEMMGRVVLQVPMEELKARVESRARAEEITGLDEEYLQQLEDAHNAKFGASAFYVPNENASDAAQMILNWIARCLQTPLNA